MDDGGSSSPGPAPLPPRLGNPGDPPPARSGRQLALVFGSMTLFFVVLVALSIWGSKNG
ncbi:hypothetical protein [Sporichthya polymorpha]|uniref:hypothetical protein n=1 Tax=Sporichthya polymorpha TaxID=35751 RepID=UPI0003A04E2A|nr:hypothetical protein [Sporichthya polymorpha]